MVIGNLIFNNILHLRMCESTEMADIILKENRVPRAYKIPSRETIGGPIIDAYYFNIRERPKRKLLNEVEVFRQSRSGDGAECNCAWHSYFIGCLLYFYCTGHLQIGNTNVSKFISYFMKGMMD